MGVSITKNIFNTSKTPGSNMAGCFEFVMILINHSYRHHFLSFGFEDVSGGVEIDSRILVSALMFSNL